MVRDVDLSTQVSDFFVGHARPDVTAANVEAFRPAAFVKYLRPVGDQHIHNDILGAGYVPEQPGDRVPAVRADAELVFTQTVQTIVL